MNILLKNRETLTHLFSTLSLSEVLSVNQNLNASWHLLALPPAQLLKAMKEKQVNIEHFLGSKCLPLVRFYLADQQSQKQVFLNAELLALLFTSLPAVEAIIFKGQIHKAQLAVQHASQALSSQLSDEYLTKKVEIKDPVIVFNGFLSSNKFSAKKSLIQLQETEKQYLNCFYYLKAGELFIAVEGESLDVDMLLYSELSPLQQLKAQKLFKLSCSGETVESMAQQNVSA